MSEEILEKVRRGEHDLDAARVFFADAREVTPDRQGRVALPLSLREYAGLTREAMVTGVLTRIEIWDTTTVARAQGGRPDVPAGRRSQCGFGI